jgi:hypothetical protein
MIDITKLVDNDKGRAVYYNSFEKREVGYITSWNDKNIFVEFRPRTMGRGEACTPSDLEWT